MFPMTPRSSRRTKMCCRKTGSLVEAVSRQFRTAIPASTTTIELLDFQLGMQAVFLWTIELEGLSTMVYRPRLWHR